MADYLPQIQHASECEWVHRREVVFPERAREAVLFGADRVAGRQAVPSALRRLVGSLRGAGARQAGASGARTELPLDRAA